MKPKRILKEEIDWSIPREIVPDYDWNFRDVPDGELIACCLWEYARESPTIMMCAAHHWAITHKISRKKDYEMDPKLAKENAKRAKRILKSHKAIKFDYYTIMDRCRDCDLGWIGIYDAVMQHVSEDARPWQLLPIPARDFLVKSVSRSLIYAPLALAHLRDLERLWEENKGPLEEALNLPTGPDDDSVMAAGYETSEQISLDTNQDGGMDGRTAAAFVIDFSRFSDKEIVEAFEKWVQQHRPTAWAQPRRFLPCSPKRGKKHSEFRLALDRLGLMRLLHWTSPEDMKKAFPSAWSIYRTKQQTFRREIREATKFFKNLFPYLPSDERPNSEERFGVWMPKMDKIIDKVDREFGYK